MGNKFTETQKLFRRYQALIKQSEKLCEARMSLPTGSSRACVTSANAKWSRAAEERTRVEKILKERGLLHEVSHD